jgi:hypothetical protein
MFAYPEFDEGFIQTHISCPQVLWGCQNQLEYYTRLPT